MFPGLSAKRTVRFRASSICRFPFAGRCFAPPYPAARDNPGNGGKGEVWLKWHNAGILSSCAASRMQRTHPPLKGLPRAVHAAQRHSREGCRRGHACMNPGRFLAAYFRGTPPHEYETAGNCILGNTRSFRKCGSRAVTALAGTNLGQPPVADALSEVRSTERKQSPHDGELRPMRLRIWGGQPQRTPFVT